MYLQAVAMPKNVPNNLNFKGLCVILYLTEALQGGYMQLGKSTILTLALVIFVAGPVCAQQSEQSMAKDARPPLAIPVAISDDAFAAGADISLRFALDNQNHYIYWSWLNSESFVKSKNEDVDRKLLRRQWQDLLGVDVFMPYFKVKEAEDFIADKTKVTLFNMKGKAHFNESRKQVEYIFKKRF